jgi:hypothetical protein
LVGQNKQLNQLRRAQSSEPVKELVCAVNISRNLLAQLFRAVEFLLWP